MGPAAAFIPAIMSVASGVMGMIGGQQAASGEERAGRESEALAAQNAELARLETEREAGVLAQQQRENAGRRRASAAASGAGGASQQLFLESQAAREASDLEYLRRTGRSRAGIETQRGVQAGAQARAGATKTRADAFGGAAGSIGSGISGVGQAAGWWE